ncbi:MAG: hypothetical protein EBX56_03710 [Betaproteobacteria bacterium]|nr:hypothetical protein [Betaproteobacteria bacterium]
MQITMRRQRKLLHRLVFLLLAIPLLGLASVQAESKASLWPSTLARQTEEPVKASLHADDAKAAAPTKAAVPARVWLGLRLEHQPGWHTYWINPGDSGLASRIEWTLPSGWTAPQAYWPMPKRIPVGPLMNFGYEGALWVPLALDVPANSPAGTYRVKARVHWLMCSDVCIPGEASLGAELRLPEQRLRQPDPSHRASVSSNESALASDKAQAAESSLGAFASNPPGLPALREALMRVPHKAMNMRYSRDGDRIVLRPDQAGEALLVGKHVDSTVNNPIEAVAQWRGGKLRPLCVFDGKRMPYPAKVTENMAWSDVPPCKDSGLDVEYLMLRGIFMAPEVSAEQQKFYLDLLQKVRETPEWKEFMERGAFNNTTMQGAAFLDWLGKEEARHLLLMKSAGFLAGRAK